MGGYAAFSKDILPCNPKALLLKALQESYLAGAKGLEPSARGFGDKSPKPFLLCHNTRGSRGFPGFLTRTIKG